MLLLQRPPLSGEDMRGSRRRNKGYKGKPERVGDTNAAFQPVEQRMSPVGQRMESREGKST